MKSKTYKQKPINQKLNWKYGNYGGININIQSISLKIFLQKRPRISDQLISHDYYPDCGL